MTPGCCEVGARPLNLHGDRQGEGKCVGVGLQVLTETVCSLIFNLQHHWTWSLWRCCQTIECSIPALQTPSSWRKVGNFGFIPFFHPCQSLFNIRFAVGLFGFVPTNASGAGQSISQASPWLCLWNLRNPRRSLLFCMNIPSQSQMVGSIREYY